MSPDRAASILARFTAAHHALLAALRDIAAEAAEHQPANGGWTPAQVGCHVAMTNEWIAGVLTGGVAGAQPAPAGFTESFNPAAIPARVKTFPTLEPPAVVGPQAGQFARQETRARRVLHASSHHADAETIADRLGIELQNTVARNGK